jgi:hypothetical protein
VAATFQFSLVKVDRQGFLLVAPTLAYRTPNGVYGGRIA